MSSINAHIFEDNYVCSCNQRMNYFGSCCICAVRSHLQQMRIKNYSNDDRSFEQNRYSFILMVSEAFVNFSISEGLLYAIQRYTIHLFLLHSCCLFW
jgi:hypothetical protein